MFLGHYAVALAAKKAAPKVSLGTLVFAAQFLDLLWPIFLLLDVEHVRILPGITAFTPLDFYDYPITHSLLATVCWGAVFALVWWARERTTRAAFVIGACVVSHWVLDFVSHRPDMPILPGVEKFVGLGLWNSVPATIAVELGAFVIGIGMYLTAKKSTLRPVAFWTFIAFCLVVYAGNARGTPPPSVNALAWFGLAQWLLIPWAYWIDRPAQPARLAAKVTSA
ncbi:MAG TPA: hypothetical protein VN577_21715 [Terriglobales bacterium]|nr:hypothetical protein [Terriglobales bacterium]